MQNHYSLIYREEEREMFPTLKVRNPTPHTPCSRQFQMFGVGSIPWSPLARGALTRPVGELKNTSRGQTDAWASGYVGAGTADVNARCVPPPPWCAEQ